MFCWEKCGCENRKQMFVYLEHIYCCINWNFFKVKISKFLLNRYEGCMINSYVWRQMTLLTQNLDGHIGQWFNLCFWMRKNVRGNQSMLDLRWWQLVAAAKTKPVDKYVWYFDRSKDGVILQHQLSSNMDTWHTALV